jgi:hypothetical protein
MEHGEINGNMDVHLEQLKSLSGSEQKNFGGFTGKPKILFVADAVTLVHVVGQRDHQSDVPPQEIGPRVT